MKYNSYFANHFRSCTLLVTGYDPHRDRKVEVRQIPGEFDVVGVSDGVDCWVAPVTVAPSPLFDKVRRVLFAIREGKAPPQEDLPSPPAAPAPTTTIRRRPITAQPAPNPEIRIRRRVISA